MEAICSRVICASGAKRSLPTPFTTPFAEAHCTASEYHLPLGTSEKAEPPLTARSRMYFQKELIEQKSHTSVKYSNCESRTNGLKKTMPCGRRMLENWNIFVYNRRIRNYRTSFQRLRYKDSASAYGSQSFRIL